MITDTDAAAIMVIHVTDDNTGPAAIMTTDTDPAAIMSEYRQRGHNHNTMAGPLSGQDGFKRHFIYPLGR